MSSIVKHQLHNAYVYTVNTLRSLQVNYVSYKSLLSVVQFGNAEIAGLDIAGLDIDGLGLDNDGRMCG